MTRTASAKARVLRALETGPQTTATLCHPDVGGERFGARVQNLRDDGYVITSAYVRQGSYLYTLAGRGPVGAASGTGLPDRPLAGPVESSERVPAPPRPALGRWHRCDRCGHGPWPATWPRECASCCAASLWLASFHDEIAAYRYRPVALPRRDITEAA